MLSLLKKSLSIQDIQNAVCEVECTKIWQFLFHIIASKRDKDTCSSKSNIMILNVLCIL